MLINLWQSTSGASAMITNVWRVAVLINDTPLVSNKQNSATRLIYTLLRFQGIERIILRELNECVAETTIILLI
jgi:hypothetical protein